MTIKYEHPLPSMRGHLEKSGECCEYHANKVKKSTKPGPEVYGAKHLEKIKGLLEVQNIKELTAEQLVLSSLNIVDNYWKENKNELDSVLKDTHQKASEACNYLAGGWQASPHQYSQLYATMWALAQKGRLKNDSNVLLSGTASGAHTKQLTEVFPAVGMDPEVHTVDICKPPLVESEHDVDSITQCNIAALPYKTGSINVVTGHFVDSFLAKKVTTHEESLEIRKDIYTELNRVTNKDGCLCMGIGTSSHIARFNSADEIEETLSHAGYKDIFVLPTTDPLDYDKTSKRHTDGNYFVVAFKS
jgi:hypothetical protein